MSYEFLWDENDSEPVNASKYFKCIGAGLDEEWLLARVFLHLQQILLTKISIKSSALKTLLLSNFFNYHLTVVFTWPCEYDASVIDGSFSLEQQIKRMSFVLGCIQIRFGPVCDPRSSGLQVRQNIVN